MDPHVTSPAERREQPSLIQAGMAVVDNDLLIAAAALATASISPEYPLALSSEQPKIPVMGEVAGSTHATCQDAGSSATAEQEALPEGVHLLLLNRIT
jgi:hypothetical protein